MTTATTFAVGVVIGAFVFVVVALCVHVVARASQRKRHTVFSHLKER